MVSSLDDAQPQYWAAPSPKGIALIVHGLNVRPQAMGSPQSEGTLVKLFLDAHYSVYRVTLAGHGGPLETMRTLTMQDWLSGAYSQYCHARLLADRASLPLYLVGFSLGGLVYETLMNESTPRAVIFDKSILFSPAIATRTLSKAILLLRPFIKDSSIIYSRAPEIVRAQKGVSLGAYKALFAMEKRLCALRFCRSNIDTRIFMDKKDELLSMRAFKKHLTQYKLSKWRIVPLSNKGAARRPAFHHVLIDAQSVSASTWQRICKEILDFLVVGFAIFACTF
ncbi:alpha/beta hydrolase [Breznakiellaceae bacterium SP9]